MVYVLILVLVILWYYKRRRYYNPYDEKYSHSSYYDCAFVSPESCAGEIYHIFRQVAGYKRILPAFRIVRREEGGKSVVLFIHESGIFVVDARNLDGIIEGNPSGRYWKQIYREGWLFPCKNYISNPFLSNKRFLDRLQWEFRDMPKLPFYSIAVYGSDGQLRTAGYMGDNRWALPLQGFAAAVGQIVRQNRRFLKPEEVELIYKRIAQGLEEGESTSQS